MTDIEQKALAMVREVLNERNLSDKRAVRREVSPYTEALCRAIEHHEATKQELADFQQKVSNVVELLVREYPLHFVVHNLSQFIIPKPDPLVEAFDALGWSGDLVDNLATKLDALGFEIREKNDG